MRQHRQPRKFEGSEWRTRRRGQFVCGVCGEVGHNARRHKDRPAPLVAKPMFLRGRPDVPHPLADGTARPASHRRTWSPQDSVDLELLWEDPRWGLNELAIKFGRSRIAIYSRAREQGLRLGLPEGAEVMEAAVRRVGATNSANLRTILEWAGVRIWPCRARNPGTKRRTFYVIADDATSAMARWCRAETVNDAAARHGVSHPTMLKWLAVAGVTKGRREEVWWRLDPDVVDRAAAAAADRRLKRYGTADSRGKQRAA